jgi:hypothetical protein
VYKTLPVVHMLGTPPGVAAAPVLHQPTLLNMQSLKQNCVPLLDVSYQPSKELFQLNIHYLG